MLSTRTDRRKLVYVAMLLALSTPLLVALGVGASRTAINALVAIGLVVGASNVIAQRVFGRWHFLARRAQRRGQHVEALDLYARALDEASKRAWMRHPEFVAFVWFSPYTNDPLAMFHNNMAVSHLSLLRLDDASRALDAAIALDPLYPTAFKNTGILAVARGDLAAAQVAFDEARRLGDRNSTTDQLIRRAAAAWGELQASGQKPSP